MSIARIVGMLLVGVLLVSTRANAQTVVKRRKKISGAEKPECTPGAICFSGEVRGGGEFRKSLNSRWQFVIKLPGGIDVVSTRGNAGCGLSAWVANPPLRAHNDLNISAGYDWTAEQEVETSPREFRFPLTCANYQRLLQMIQSGAGGYLDRLPSLAQGQGRLWITGSKVTHAHGVNGKENGAVEWLKFTVEIKLPKSK